MSIFLLQILVSDLPKMSIIDVLIGEVCKVNVASVGRCAVVEGHRSLQHKFLIELLRQARVSVRTVTSHVHSLVRGEDSDGHSMNKPMECAAVGTMMLFITSVGTMYVSYISCMATTILSGMAHLKHRLRLGNHGRNFMHLHGIGRLAHTVAENINFCTKLCTWYL